MFAIKRISSYAAVLLLFCANFLLTHQLHAQAPERVNYQAVARNNAGDPLANTTLPFVRFSIIATSTSGTVLYEEEHPMVSTNLFGLFNLVIGQGSRTGGTAANFAGIDWSSGNRFLRVEVDAGSGFENLGTTQLLSVPYALYAKTSGNASSNLSGGNGITIRNDSIINDGDLSETNELITSFSIEAGNILRITEATTNFDVDLTPLLPATADDQNLSFSSNGDSILIDNGDGIEIQFILDDITNNAADILTNQTDITNLNTDLNTLKGNFSTDSSQTLQNQDSIAILATLISSAADNQNLSLANDSILIERGTGIDIDFLATDAKLSADSALLAAGISTNETDITNLNADLNTLESNFSTDSSQTIQNSDSIDVLAGLIGNVTDNQNLSIVGDSIVIDRGTNIGIGFITDSITNYNSRIITNTTSISSNLADIISSRTDITNLDADLSTLEINFTIDSSQTQQNRDSISILESLITSDNDADSTNELIDSIRFVGRTLEVYQQGNAQTISFDTLFDSRRLNLFNRTIQNRDSIDAVVAIINGIINNDNDTSASNEIQQLSLVADQLSIDDPSGTVTQTPIDLSIYDNPEDSTRIANGTSRVFIPTANDSISFVAGGNEALRIDNTGRSYFKQAVGIGTSIPDSLLEVNGGAKVGALNINGAYTLPTTDGIGEQFLQTDGSGSVSWSSTVPTPNCPTGMTNVQGNICIETNERAASDWYDAANTCASLGYKLPTWAEWYGAATNAVLTNEINNWEWVSDGTSNTARKVGNANLKSTANDDPETGLANFRCIFYK